MSTGLKANNDGSAAIQVGGTDYLTVTSGGAVTIPGALTVTGAFAGAVPIQPITASVSGNALTVTLNPTTLAFRSSTLSSGTVNTRNVANAISMTVSSGSTLGTVNNVASRIVVLAIDNAGTVELAVVNIAGGNQLDETNLISTTAEGGAGAADSNNVIYSTTARSNVPYRVVGFIDSTQTTAGTWGSAPTTIQGIGGQALASMSSLGFGQTYTLITNAGVGSSKVSGTTYYNTTGKPRMVIVSTLGTATSVSITVNGSIIASQISAGSSLTSVTAIVQPSASYVVTANSGSIYYWAELG